MDTLNGRDHRTAPSAILRAARQELIDETVRGRGGRAAVERYAARVDALLQRLLSDAPHATSPVLVLALGGYGRRHLCLHSDVDVLMLFDGKIGSEDERCVRGFLNPLWDLDLVVGHQVRELRDFEQLETDNAEFLLALLDARPVAGDRSLLERFTSSFRRWQTHAFILESLRRLMEVRHAEFNDTLYQLEPDVKNAPGALRDLFAIRTIAAITDPSLLEKGPRERGRLDEAEDFLIRVRSVLHHVSRRDQNVLSHELQETVAPMLGYPGAQLRQQVEALMGDYFRHARVVVRSLEWMSKTAPTPVGENLVRWREGIRFVDKPRAARHPESWLSVFQRAIDTGAPVAADTLAWIHQHVNRYAPEDFFPSAAERRAILTLLKPKPGLYERLSEIHDCGLLNRMFPEFQAVSSRVVRDFYHKYTVDEHTLLTIKSLVRLSTSASAGPAPTKFSALAAGVETPELLVLSLLYHDIGKWRDDEHVMESVRMAQQMLERLDLPPDSRDMVEFLIRNHLHMSIAAFRRDTGDPETARRLATVVGTEERLKMLCLMTLVDLAAVSPESLTPWREELLWQLYVDTYNHLTLGYGDEVIDRSQAGPAELMAKRPADLDEAEISQFLEGLPRRYLQLFEPEAIYRHVRLSRDISPDQVHASLEQKGPTWEMTVVTVDKPFLFSNICGVLSSFGMDILRGYALVNTNGLVLDTFQFTDRERFFELIADGRAQFLHELEEVVSGRTDVAVRLRSRERSVLYRRPVSRFAPTIHADNQSSRRYTIVEIVAQDMLGLLHRISRVISRHGCDVGLVLIATEGEKAIDVFHITRGGAKLSEAAQVELRADLQRMLEEPDEVD